MQGEGTPRGPELPPLSKEPGSPPSAEASYCDLPRCPPAPEDTLSTATSSCQLVVGPGLGQLPERWVEPRA